MNKLLQKVRSSTKKDDLVKNSITTHLSNSVKEIQYSGIEEQKSNKSIDTNEACNQLCVSIEAIFLHGLKDTISHRFKRAIADIDERPEPNFWPSLLIISHRQIIDQISNLSQITTEVGQCRAWVRLALNDCLLSSYLMIVRQDPKVIKSFYNAGAYLRDSDLLDVAQHLIEGVETFKTKFTLPCNSSLLNTWPFPSLFLAGIWAPTLKSCPVAPCDDVAQSLDDDNSTVEARAVIEADRASIYSGVSTSSQNSGVSGFLTEDQLIEYILNKEKKRPSNEENSSQSSEIPNKPAEDNLEYRVGNSLTIPGWSFDRTQEEESDVQETQEPQTEKQTQPKSMDTSFSDLIKSYNDGDGHLNKTPDIREIWQKFEDKRTEGLSPVHHSITNVDDKNQELLSTNLEESESISFSEQVGKICKEKGFDKQNYECAGCKNELNITQKPKVCGFTGEYFCDSCMHDESIQIPARVIHNWDFKFYPVSKRSFAYINEIKDSPIIDFKILNPYIYGAVQDMVHLQVLRNQLNFLRAYLYTCREPIIEQLQKQMSPREYMYEHIHQYSFSDLLEIPCKTLSKYLETAVTFGKEHVFGCWLCSQKGFVCEVCNKSKPLFPFDVENIYRCETCNAVYHRHCLNSSKPCPKCERKKKRVDLPVVGSISIE